MQLLALRDELRSRTFDAPAAWWSDHPGVIGGRDRAAGGSWCVSDVATGVTAVVLNRPERRFAEQGAPSRGVLPLMAVRHGEHWTDSLDITGMAGFNLVLVSVNSLRWWWFDGEQLMTEALGEGTYRFTPLGLASTADTGSELDQHFADGHTRIDELQNGEVARVWPEWLAVVDEVAASDDRTGLIVRKPYGDDSYETVFGQFIVAEPGFLRLDYLNNPADGTDRQWTTECFGEAVRAVPQNSSLAR